MVGFIIFMVILFLLFPFSSKDSIHEGSSNEKSFFFGGGDELTDEDYIFLSMIDDEDEL